MDLKIYKKLANKQSIATIPNFRDINALKIARFHSIFSKRCELILSRTDIEDEIKLRLLNEYAEKRFSYLKEIFQSNKDGFIKKFIEPFLINSLSEKYINNLKRRFERDLIEQFGSDNEKVAQKLEQLFRDKLHEKRVNQKHTLTNWYEYLLVENQILPPWFKYLTIRSIITFFDRDTGSQTRRRNEETAENYLRLDRQVLPETYEKLKNQTDSAKLNFFNLYKEGLSEKRKQNKIIKDLQPEDYLNGEWREFTRIKQNVDSFEMLDPIYKQEVLNLNHLSENSPWCLDDPQTAYSYLIEGPVRIYLVKNVPKISMHLKEDEDGNLSLNEIRGDQEDESFDYNTLPIIQNICDQLLSEGITTSDSVRKELSTDIQKAEIEHKSREANSLIEEVFKADDIEILTPEVVAKYFEFNLGIGSEVLNLDLYYPHSKPDYVDSQSQARIDVMAGKFIKDYLGFADISSDEIQPLDLNRSGGYLLVIDENYQLNYKASLNHFVLDKQFYLPNSKAKFTSPLVYLNGLSIQGLKKSFIYGLNDYFYRFFPEMRRISELSLEASKFSFPKLEEINFLYLKDSSAIDLPNIKKINHLVFKNTPKGCIKIKPDKSKKLQVKTIDIDYSSLQENIDMLRSLDLDYLEKVAIRVKDEMNYQKLLELDYIFNGLDKQKIVFPYFGEYDIDISFSYNDYKWRLMMYDKFQKADSEFNKQELEYVFDLEKPLGDYWHFRNYMNSAREKIEKNPIRLRQSLSKLFPDHIIALTQNEITSQTQIIYTSDKYFSLESNDSRLSNLILMKGMLNLNDDEFYVSNLEYLFGDLDLTYLENTIFEFNNLKKITGKIHLRPDSSEAIKDFAEKLKTKCGGEIELI